MQHGENVSSLLWFLPSSRAGEKNQFPRKEIFPVKETANRKNREIFLEPHISNLMITWKKYSLSKEAESTVSNNSENETYWMEFYGAKVLFQWVQMEFVFTFLYLFENEFFCICLIWRKTLNLENTTFAILISPPRLWSFVCCFVNGRRNLRDAGYLKFGQLHLKLIVGNTEK